MKAEGHLHLRKCRCEGGSNFSPQFLFQPVKPGQALITPYNCVCLMIAYQVTSFRAVESSRKVWL